MARPMTATRPRGARRHRALLIAGTASDVGKSVIVAGLCRALSDTGLTVAPFKAQNMSLNSFVTTEGGEIGRAQASQAAAARVEPEVRMNPILLKPGSDTSSQVIVLGRAVGEVHAGQYWNRPNPHLDVVVDAFHSLAARFDAVICEGAGSAAEINLRAHDIANLGFARAAGGIPTLLVTDIDRGGAFASLYGTHQLLDEPDRELIGGFILNRFRGDARLLQPAVGKLTELTGRPTLGIIPWTEGIGIDTEDALQLEVFARTRPPIGSDVLRVHVIAYPRVSNHTDFEPLAEEPGLIVRFVRHPAQLADADLVILPGSRATVTDLEWLRTRGFEPALAERARNGQPILGICAGYQMLGRTIADPVESGAGQVTGLGLLPVITRFRQPKVVRQRAIATPDGPVTGYEIHLGRVTVEAGAPFIGDTGCMVGSVAGTELHGLFENDWFRRDYLRSVAARTGRDFQPDEQLRFAMQREEQLDRIARLVADHLDLAQVRAMLAG